MTDFNKGDFTQQGVDGHVNAKLRLNAKRYVDIDLTSNEQASGCTISGHVYDSLNDITYPIGSAPSGNIEITENTAEDSPLNIAQYATATVNVSGGSGDSDFTTAQITIISNTIATAVKGFVVYDEEGFEAIAFYGTLSTGTDELTVPLYKGTAIWETLPQQDQYITVSGNITKDSDDGVLIITGDGTITYSKLD